MKAPIGIARMLFSRLRGRPAARVFTRGLSELLRQYNVSGPVCHVGSKNREESQEGINAFRSLFSSLSDPSFVGLDIEPGPNVDIVADICAPLPADLVGRFGLVFCSALLEHVKNPFLAAANIQKLLRPGGHLYFAGPWVWGYHAYPDDYWRISFSGIKVLFPGISFLEWWYSGTRGKTCIAIEHPDDERAVLQELGALWNRGSHISDRAMPYLNIAAIGVRQEHLE